MMATKLSGTACFFLITYSHCTRDVSNSCGHAGACSAVTKTPLSQGPVLLQARTVSWKKLPAVQAEEAPAIGQSNIKARSDLQARSSTNVDGHTSANLDASFAWKHPGKQEATKTNQTKLAEKTNQTELAKKLANEIKGVKSIATLQTRLSTKVGDHATANLDTSVGWKQWKQQKQPSKKDGAAKTNKTEPEKDLKPEDAAKTNRTEPEPEPEPEPAEEPKSGAETNATEPEEAMNETEPEQKLKEGDASETIPSPSEPEEATNETEPEQELKDGDASETIPSPTEPEEATNETKAEEKTGEPEPEKELQEEFQELGESKEPTSELSPKMLTTGLRVATLGSGKSRGRARAA